MPLVSVVIPVYNRLDLLRDTLESVVSQSFSDLEVIVIDDGSTEPLYPLIHQYGNRVTFIRLFHSGLPSIVRNCGVKKANGRYIAFLDSDDLWLPDKLKTQMQVFSDRPDLALVCSNAYVFASGTQVKPKSLYFNDDPHEKTGFLLDDLIYDNFIITSTCIVRSDVLREIGGFSEDPAFRGIEDYELWLRITRQYPGHFIPAPLVYYRDSGPSIRSEISMVRYYEGINKIYVTLLSELPVSNQYPFTQKCLNKKILENNVAILCLFLETGDKPRFRSLFKDLIKISPFMIPKLFTHLLLTYFKMIRAGMVETWSRFE